MKDLAGRTAFVTGGANGIGLGLARRLLDEGCRVAIADIREDSIRQALKTLDNREVMGVTLDVTSRDRFAEAADEVEERFGPVSLLFNNAGINLFLPIDEIFLRRLGLGARRQSRRRHQRRDDLRAQDEGARGRRPHRQHRLDGELPRIGIARHLQLFEIRGARYLGIAAPQPARARHRRLGALPRPGRQRDLRSRRNPHAGDRGRRPRHRSRLRRDARQCPQGRHGSARSGRQGDRGDQGQPLLHIEPSEFRDELAEVSTRSWRISATRRPIPNGSNSKRCAASATARNAR